MESNKSFLGGDSKIFYFQPYLGKIPNLTNIFQMTWNHQLVLMATKVIPSGNLT